jgi:hypothetical protein
LQSEFSRIRSPRSIGSFRYLGKIQAAMIGELGLITEQAQAL